MRVYIPIWYSTLFYLFGKIKAYTLEYYTGAEATGRGCVNV